MSFAVPVCAECGRAEQFPAQLEFVSKPSGGCLVQVCKGCFFLSELKALITQVESAETRNLVVTGLEALYPVAKEQVETELSGSATRWERAAVQRKLEPKWWQRR